MLALLLVHVVQMLDQAFCLATQPVPEHNAHDAKDACGAVMYGDCSQVISSLQEDLHYCSGLPVRDAETMPALVDGLNLVGVLTAVPKDELVRLDPCSDGLSNATFRCPHERQRVICVLHGTAPILSRANSSFYNNYRSLGGARPGTESYPPNSPASSVLRPEAHGGPPASYDNTGDPMLSAAPDIKEEIPFLPQTTAGRDRVAERGVGAIIGELRSVNQRHMWAG